MSDVQSASSISNRNYLQALLEWGWDIKKQRGTVVELVSPLDGRTIKVQAPESHQKNGAYVTSDILRHMNINWSTLLDPHPALNGDIKVKAAWVENLRDVYTPGGIKRDRAMWSKIRQNRKKAWAEQESKPPVYVPTPADVPVDTKTRVVITDSDKTAAQKENDVVKIDIKPGMTAEERIEAALDVLCPDGFKARHIKALNAWVEATETLLLTMED